jgi:hypothetical protein
VARPPAPSREKERVPATTAGAITTDVAAAQAEAGERSQLWTAALTAIGATADSPADSRRMPAADGAGRALGGQ